MTPRNPLIVVAGGIFALTTATLVCFGVQMQRCHTFGLSEPLMSLSEKEILTPEEQRVLEVAKAECKKENWKWNDVKMGICKGPQGEEFWIVTVRPWPRIVKSIRIDRKTEQVLMKFDDSNYYATYQNGEKSL